ncbi:MAG: hypothetical protein EXR79_15085, partial [Myxococcales bacterium]|nr:hypothetical protein [Myxococcales bacterium]
MPGRAGVGAGSGPAAGARCTRGHGGWQALRRCTPRCPSAWSLRQFARRQILPAPQVPERPMNRSPSNCRAAATGVRPVAWMALGLLTTCSTASPAGNGGQAPISDGFSLTLKDATGAGNHTADAVAAPGTADGALLDVTPLDAAPLDAASTDAAGAGDAPGAAADAGPDCAPVPAPDAVAECPGGAGCSCTTHTGCTSGHCADTPDGKRCGQPCQTANNSADCTKGFVCKPFSGPVCVAALCLPAHGKLCQPCNATKDCESQGITGVLCVDQGPLGRFCGAPCTVEADCPDGYACAVSQSPEGPKALQCVKKAGAASSDAFGTCSCWQASKQAGAATECWSAQVDLAAKTVGKCPGLRTCGPTGLGACVLVAPKADLCDGVDNDCNGKIDDGASGCPATQTCIAGKCQAGCSPVDGGWSEWSYSVCSAACGAGTKSGTRTCTQPAPACGGKACEGAAMSSEACNDKPCTGTDFPKGTTIYSQGGEVAKGNVPPGVTSVTVKLWGGGGGGCSPGNGGGGALVHATVAVKAGDALEVRVAGGGVS